MKRMSWSEIQKKYPNQYVALTNVEPDIYNIKWADVLYAETNNISTIYVKSASEIVAGALEGKWYACGTNIDSELQVGALQ